MNHFMSTLKAKLDGAVDVILHSPRKVCQTIAQELDTLSKGTPGSRAQPSDPTVDPAPTQITAALHSDSDGALGTEETLIIIRAHEDEDESLSPSTLNPEASPGSSPPRQSSEVLDTTAATPLPQSTSPLTSALKPSNSTPLSQGRMDRFGPPRRMNTLGVINVAVVNEDGEADEIEIDATDEEIIRENTQTSSPNSIHARRQSISDRINRRRHSELAAGVIRLSAENRKREFAALLEEHEECLQQVAQLKRSSQVGGRRASGASNGPHNSPALASPSDGSVGKFNGISLPNAPGQQRAGSRTMYHGDSLAYLKDLKREVMLSFSASHDDIDSFDEAEEEDEFDDEDVDDDIAHYDGQEHEVSEEVPSRNSQQKSQEDIHNSYGDSVHLVDTIPEPESDVFAALQ